MKYTFIILSTILLLFSSCSDWLDVAPLTEVRESELFTTEEGYKEAMNGVYIKLGQAGLYGQTVTMFIPEMLTRNWTVPEESVNPAGYYLSKFDYKNSNAESAINGMWTQYYSAIAQINNILVNMQSTSVKFSYGNKDLIEGECYGLRAFLHLDLMRFFGPVPVKVNGKSKCIPYVTDFTTDLNKLQSSTYDEVTAHIEADLNKAEKLLAKVDPAIKSTVSLDLPNASADIVFEDTWQYYRQIHFNYFAVLGTKARLYYWLGQKEKAVENALKVINATDQSGKKEFALFDEAYISSHTNAWLNMKIEHLFGVYNSNFMNDVYYKYYSNNTPLFTQDAKYVSTAYESNLYPDDIRNKGTRYWELVSDGSTAATNRFNKYSYKGIIGSYTVPCIRLSEMYFILFEEAELAQMMPYFQTWRTSRGLDSSIDNTLTSSSAVTARMEKEWRKEFFGEGQMFFFYKKHAYTSISWPATFEIPSLDSYVIPTPKSQTSFER